MGQIVVIDYHKGNLLSVERGLLAAGAEVCVSDQPQAIAQAEALVLPGVGSFGDAMSYLNASGQAAEIVSAVRSGTPILGICLGMQLFFTRGNEGAAQDEWISGLDLLPGECVHFPKFDLKVPHVGWNEIFLRPQTENPAGAKLFAQVSQQTHFYFTHSYYVQPADPAVTAASTDYGIRFTSAIAAGKIFGCQFHPEKSARLGNQVLQNFVDIVRTNADISREKAESLHEKDCLARVDTHICGNNAKDKGSIK